MTHMEPVNAQMQAVLDALASLGGKPIESCTPALARRQPLPDKAVKALLEARGQPATPEPVAKVEDREFTGPGGRVAIRIYTPEGSGPFPVLLYIHGGGWVIADLDTYDASPRAMANAVGAVVVSTHYRQGPEDKFPAAHDDTLSAYRWVLDNAEAIDGDPGRIGLVGESAGGNMAANIAIAARDQGLQAPLHQVLVYPVADNDLDSPSYRSNADAKPLSKPMIEWMVGHYLHSLEESADPRIALLRQPDLCGLPPTTIITAQTDPLRSDGEKLAQALRDAGNSVEHRNYDGVAHEFFGMAAVLDAAKEAQAFAAGRLRDAFAADTPAQAFGFGPRPVQDAGGARPVA